MAGTEMEHAENSGVVTKVDPAEVPSAAFGWSGESRMTFKVAGVVVIVILLAMLYENQQGASTGWTGYIYLILFAAAIAGVLIRDTVLKNKPK